MSREGLEQNKINGSERKKCKAVIGKIRQCLVTIEAKVTKLIW